jgi:hypothetical protein
MSTRVAMTTMYTIYTTYTIYIIYSCGVQPGYGFMLRPLPIWRLGGGPFHHFDLARGSRYAFLESAFARLRVDLVCAISGALGDSRAVGSCSHHM